MSDEALLPCPFCGKDCVAMNMAYMAGDPDDWQVFCNGDGPDAETHRTECGYEGPYADTEAEAITKHNLIARPSVSTAELEKMEAYHRGMWTDSGDSRYDADYAQMHEAFADELRTLISKATNGRGK